MAPDAMILVFWMLSFKPTFSLSSFTFIKRLFSSSSLSAIRVMSSAYKRILIFLPAILIPACASSSLAFHVMYSVYKLNKQGDSIQPWCTPFPIWNQSVVPCPVLTVASWPVYRFLRRQVRWYGIPISFRIFQFVVIHTVKCFSIVNKAKVDVFLELSCFFDDPGDVSNLIYSDNFIYCTFRQSSFCYTAKICVCVYIYIFDTRDYLISIGRCHTYYTQTGKLQISQKYECIKWKRKCSYSINFAIPLKEYV